MSRNLIIFAFIILALALLGGLVGANTLYARKNPNEKDFLVPWLGARTFLHDGISPYNDQVAQRAQLIYYGRLAEPGEDPLRLAVSFPIELFYFPIGLITDYSLARGIWMTILEAALISLTLLSLRLVNWIPGRILKIIITLFSILWFYSLFSLANASSTVFVSLAIVGLLFFLYNRSDELAGVMLLPIAFKVDMAGIFFLFILWWIIINRRWRVIGGFLMTLILLMVFAFLFFPGWFMPYLRGVVSHAIHNSGLTPRFILTSWWPAIGGRLSWILTLGLAIALFLEWRAVRKQDYRHFLWTTSLTLTITPLLGIPVSPVDFVILVLPLILCMSVISERWANPSGWGVGGILLTIFFLIHWVWTSYLLIIGASFTGVVMLLFPIFLFGCLYWVRWWAIYPKRSWLEELLEEAE